jgi:response regulator RpfG family c-di-GMP phosphodiesterase
MAQLNKDFHGKILFVDDEANILKALRRLLADTECEVFIASSGVEGLKILQENPDMGLVVSDQRMPVMTGVEFLAQARALAPDTVRILLTGYADIHAVVDAINKGGAYRYITKPWNDDELLQSLKAAMQHYHLIQENKRLQAELKRWSLELEAIVQEQTMELTQENAKVKALNTHLRANFKSTISAFSALLELRDKRMRSHARNVADMASKVAIQLNLPSEEVEMVVIASLIHDIGKVGMSDVLLSLRPDELNQQENEEYVKHPVRGQAAVDVIPDLRKVGEIIRHHHEQYDGKGFPDKLKGEQIPMAARLISIADFIDVQVRKFTEASGVDLTLQKLKAEGHKRFDPRLISLFVLPAKELYKKTQPQTGYVELELFPKDLEEGMVLGRDVFSGTGVLLLSKGVSLNRTNIQVLKRYYDLDPAKHGVVVWVK